MTTATAPRKRTPRKPLRIRSELLPESARYITIDDIEYVAMPVAEFGDWYEDVEDRVIVEERRKFDDGPTVSLEEIKAEIKREKAKRS